MRSAALSFCSLCAQAKALPWRPFWHSAWALALTPPLVEPERILQVRERFTKLVIDPIPLADGSLVDYRRQVQSAQMITYETSPFSLIFPNADPECYFGVQVSEDLLRLASR